MAAIVDQLSDEQLFRAIMDIIRDGGRTYNNINTLNTIKSLNLNTNTRDDMLKIMSTIGITKEKIVFKKMSEGINLQGVVSGGIIQDSATAREQHIYRMRHQLALKTRNHISNTIPDPISSSFISTKQTSQLIKMDSLRCLKKGQINFGAVLFCHVVEPVYPVVGLQCLVADSTNQLFTLTIYNLVSSQSSFEKCQTIVPLNSVIAVKEPYVKCFNSGYLGIRVDHPKNVDIITEKKNDHHDSYCDLKEKGNDLYKLCQYENAIDAYKSALNDAIVDNGLKVTLLSNCAACHLKLLMFECALSDTITALEVDPTHVKSIYRKAEALIGLRRYEASKISLMSLPDNLKDKRLTFVETSIRQSVQGVYSPGDDTLENYFSSSLEVRKSPGKGRGIYLIKSVKKGDLLIVEKPFISSSFEPHSKGTQLPTLDYKQRTATVNDQLLHQILEKTEISKAGKARLSILYDGETSNYYIPNIDFYRYDDHSDFDGINEKELTIKQLLGVLDFNCFGNNKLSDLYVFISLINHSNTPNCLNNMFEEKNNVRLVTADKDMDEGTELSIKYADNV